MKKKDLKELRKKPDTDLGRNLMDERGRLSNLKFDLSLGKVNNIREIRKIKENIAQILTVIKEKQK